MKWHKYNIEISQLPKLIKQMEIAVKNGDPTLEHLYCVYTIEESNLIYCLTPFDFIDKNIEELKIKTFSTYQVLEN